MKTNIKDIPLTEKQKEQLIALGFKESEITSETLLDVALYKKALQGNIAAQNMLKAEHGGEDTDDEGAVDITYEVKQEEEKLLSTLATLSDVQKSINSELIHNVAFQSVTLRHLADDIAKNGVKEKYKNGANQWGWKDRTEVKTYNNMIKSYQACMKQINDLVNNNGLDNAYDEFDEFNS